MSLATNGQPDAAEDAQMRRELRELNCGKMPTAADCGGGVLDGPAGNAAYWEQKHRDEQAKGKRS